ncbi:MAG: DnrO protein [Stenotrophomonas sp.]
MRYVIPFATATLLVAGLLALPATAYSQHDAHAHAHDAHAGAVVAPAQQWPGDAPLREGMRKIRVAVEGLEHYEHGHMGIAQATATVALIDEAIANIFANCKLEPDADMALHGLLATFMAGAEAVRTSPQVPRAEIAQMQQALAQYPRLFDDPQWDAAVD